MSKGIDFGKKLLGVAHHKMHHHKLSGTFFRIQISLLFLKLCRRLELCKIFSKLLSQKAVAKLDKAEAELKKGIGQITRI